jgi:cytochrome d ubiquinol oxidase subunit I
MVALGSIFSSIWIVVANSWQQTPAGHHFVPVMRDGAPLLRDGEPVLRAEIVDFWALVFNPSTVHRLVHVWIGAFIMGAFFVMSISAWYLLRRKHEEFASVLRRRPVAGGGLLLAMLASGHAGRHGLSTSRRRSPPSKPPPPVGRPEPRRHARAEAETVRLNVAVPGGLSLLLHGDASAGVVGLDRFRREDRPPVALSFASYHVMVGLGFLFIGLTLLACVLRWRGQLYEKRWLMWVFVFAVAAPIAANQLGWVAAEVGRQPWIVHPPVEWLPDGDLAVGPDGHVVYDEKKGLRTADAVSPALRGGEVLASLIGFGLLYLSLAAVWLFVLDRKIKQGPEAPGGMRHADEGVLEAVRRRAAHEGRMTGEDESPAGGAA